MENTSKSNSTLLKVDRVIEKVAYILAAIGAVVIIFIMLLACADAFGNKVFNRSIPRATSLITYLNVATVFMGVAYVQLTDKHTTICLVFDRLPKAARKFFYLLANVISVLICAYLTYTSWLKGMNLFQGGNLSETVSGFPLWPFAFVMWFGWLTLTLACVWSIVREVTKIKELPDPDMTSKKHVEKSESDEKQ